VKSPKVLLRILIHGRSDHPPSTPARVVLRWARIAVLIVTGLITLQSLLLVAGFVAGYVTGAVIAALVLVMFGLLWFALPLTSR